MSRKHWILTRVGDDEIPARFRYKPWGKLRPRWYSDLILTVCVVNKDGMQHVGSTRQYFNDSAGRIVLPFYSPQSDPLHVTVVAHPFFIGMDVQKSGREFVRQMNAKIAQHRTMAVLHWQGDT